MSTTDEKKLVMVWAPVKQLEARVALFKWAELFTKAGIHCSVDYDKLEMKTSKVVVRMVYDAKDIEGVKCDVAFGFPNNVKIKTNHKLSANLTQMGLFKYVVREEQKA